jgi:hypothetical protein
MPVAALLFDTFLRVACHELNRICCATNVFGMLAWHFSGLMCWLVDVHTTALQWLLKARVLFYPQYNNSC